MIAQTTVATFTVHAGAYDRHDVLVSVELNGVNLPEDWSTWRLVEQVGRRRPVAMQWQPGPRGTLSWVVLGKTAAGSTRQFSLQQHRSSQPSFSPAVVVREDSGSMTFLVNKKEVLTYQYALASVPAGVDKVYRRGGFIHPLRSLGGGVLTRMQPPDHYHHYGIWNPWTHTEYQGREIDFWNLAKKQGTVRAKGVTDFTSGAVFGELTAWHEAVAYPDSADQTTVQKILNETWHLRVWRGGSEQKMYLVDFVSVQNNVTSDPLTVKEYRYQGFGFRANQRWNDTTAYLLTSAGKSKANGNSTRARWCDMRGPTVAGTSGVLMMGHPANFNFPEPIRIWPEGANEGEGNVFFTFNPAQDRDMILEPQQPRALKYRMLVYDGDIDAAMAQRHWQDFAYPPRVEVTWFAEQGRK